MLGMSLSTFTTVHVIISLVGIGSGLIVIFGMLSAKRPNGWTALFLLTTVLTSVTGFGFPFTHVTPGHKVGGHLAGGAADRDPRALQLSHGGQVAFDLRGHGDHCRISQCLRTRRAGPRESAGAEGDGAHAA